MCPNQGKQIEALLFPKFYLPKSLPLFAHWGLKSFPLSDRAAEGSDTAEETLKH